MLTPPESHLQVEDALEIINRLTHGYKIFRSFTSSGYGCEDVIMLVGKRAALNRPLETVKNQIKRLIQRDGVEKARLEFIEVLKDRTEIKVDQALVAAVQAELAQARPGKPEGAGRPQAKARPGMAPPATQ